MKISDKEEIYLTNGELFKKVGDGLSRILKGESPGEDFQGNALEVAGLLRRVDSERWNKGGDSAVWYDALSSTMGPRSYPEQHWGLAMGYSVSLIFLGNTGILPENQRRFYASMQNFCLDFYNKSLEVERKVGKIQKE